MGGSLKILKALKEILYYANKDRHENKSIMIKFKAEIGLFYMKAKLYAQG